MDSLTDTLLNISINSDLGTTIQATSNLGQGRLRGTRYQSASAYRPPTAESDSTQADVSESNSPSSIG